MSTARVNEFELAKWGEIVPEAEAFAIAAARQIGESRSWHPTRHVWTDPPVIEVESSPCAEWLIMDGRALRTGDNDALILCTPLVGQFAKSSRQNEAATLETFATTLQKHLARHGVPATLLGMQTPQQGAHAVA